MSLRIPFLLLLSMIIQHLFSVANKKVCHLKLTPITISENSAAVNQSQSCPSEKEHTSMTNNKEALQTCNLKISKNHLSNSWKSSLVTAPMLSTVEDAASHHRSSSTIQFCLKTDQKIETEPSETEHENAFFIKGVICHGSVPPSWLHPTKLYSCLSYGNPSTAGSSDSETSVLPCSSGLLQQVVLLISSKGLNMVRIFEIASHEM